MGEGFQIVPAEHDQLLEPGVFLGQFLRACGLSNTLESLNAVSTSAKRRENFSICGRKSILDFRFRIYD